VDNVDNFVQKTKKLLCNLKKSDNLRKNRTTTSSVKKNYVNKKNPHEIV